MGHQNSSAHLLLSTALIDSATVRSSVLWTSLRSRNPPFHRIPSIYLGSLVTQSFKFFALHSSDSHHHCQSSDHQAVAGSVIQTFYV